MSQLSGIFVVWCWECLLLLSLLLNFWTMHLYSDRTNLVIANSGPYCNFCIARTVLYIKLFEYILHDSRLGAVSFHFSLFINFLF